MSQIEFLQRRVDGRLAVPAREIAPILGFSIQTFTTMHADGMQVIANKLICNKRVFMRNGLYAWMDNDPLAPALQDASLAKPGRGLPPKPLRGQL